MYDAIPSASSELAVYERLRDQLPGDFVCYYSAPWHLAAADGTETDGEADFVVAHPRDGLLMLEVKGGRISRRSEDAQWLSTDRNGFTFRIKDPVAQARASKHAIVKKLRAQAALKSRYVKAAHAVVLSGSARPLKSLGADAPLELIAFGDDMTGLGEWVRARMASVDPDAEECTARGS